MRFMLMMHAPRGTGDYQIGSWSPEALKAHMDFMHRLNKELTDAGERVGTEGLAPHLAGRSPNRRSSSRATGSSRSIGPSAPTRSPRRRHWLRGLTARR